MFAVEGPTRSPQKNRRLAGYLALVAGFVNSASFVLLGSFTSHVTGSVGRLTNDMVARDFPAAISALLLIVSFWLGAFIASSMLHTGFFRRAPHAYAAALFVEAAVLLIFAVLSDGMEQSPRKADAYAGMLCLAMGMQNSLVTYISGARVRTTHLTGVVTDLGIEAARWWRWHRTRIAARTALPLVLGPNRQQERPDKVVLVLLLTIVVFFLFGAVGGAELASLIGARAMIVPGLAALLASAFALTTGRGPG